MPKYIKEIPEYIPQIQPWQPNLQLYQNALMRRQQQYDNNFSKLNSLYNSLFNSPLTRQVDVQRRDEFLKLADFEIKRLSAVDLSNQQNLNAAYNVFKPLYENENMIHDWSYTKKIRNEFNKAEALKNCTDPKKCPDGLYWDGGIEYMNYQIQDYADSSDEEALKMNAPKFIPAQNVAKDANKIIKDAKLKTKVVDWVGDGKYRLTTENGEPLRQPLQSYLNNVFSNDPKYQAFYNVKADLEKRRWLSENEMKYNNEQEAENKYAMIQLDQAYDVFTDQELQNNTVYKNVDNQLSQFEQFLRKHHPEEYETEHHEFLKDQEETIESEKQRLERIQMLLSNGVDIRDINTYNNRINSIVSNNMLQTDLEKIATDYAYGTIKQTIKADEYASAKWKMDYKFAIDQEMAKIKHEYKLDEIEKKEEIKLNKIIDAHGGSVNSKAKNKWKPWSFNYNTKDPNQGFVPRNVEAEATGSSTDEIKSSEGQVIEKEFIDYRTDLENDISYAQSAIVTTFMKGIEGDSTFGPIILKDLVNRIQKDFISSNTLDKSINPFYDKKIGDQILNDLINDKTGASANAIEYINGILSFQENNGAYDNTKPNQEILMNHYTKGNAFVSDYIQSLYQFNGDITQGSDVSRMLGFNTNYMNPELGNYWNIVNQELQPYFKLNSEKKIQYTNIVKNESEQLNKVREKFYFAGKIGENFYSYIPGDYIVEEGQGNAGACTSDLCIENGVDPNLSMSELIQQMYWPKDREFPYSGQEFVDAYVDAAEKGYIKSMQYDEQAVGSQPDYFRSPDRGKVDYIFDWNEAPKEKPYFHKSEAIHHAKDLHKVLDYNFKRLYGEHVTPPSIMSDLEGAGGGTAFTSKELYAQLSTLKRLSQPFVLTRDFLEVYEENLNADGVDVTIPGVLTDSKQKKLTKLIFDEILKPVDYSKMPQGAEYIFDVDYNAVTANKRDIASLTIYPDQKFIDKYQGTKNAPGPTRNWNHTKGIRIELPYKIAEETKLFYGVRSGVEEKMMKQWTIPDFANSAGTVQLKDGMIHMTVKEARINPETNKPEIYTSVLEPVNVEQSLAASQGVSPNDYKGLYEFWYDVLNSYRIQNQRFWYEYNQSRKK